MQDTRKEITSVTAEGINYIDEEGNSQFIDFETCHQNYVTRMGKIRGSKFTDEDKAFWQRAKYVGVRYALSDPPALEFYTEPRIYFEFSTRS